MKAIVFTRKQQTLRKQEMEAIQLRQKQLEETNRQLREKGGELRKSLRDLDITHDRYQELHDLPIEDLSIQEYVAVRTRFPRKPAAAVLVATSRVRFSATLCLQMRFYEAVTPLQTQLAELRARKDSLSEELDLHRNQTKTLMEVKLVFEVFSLSYWKLLS